MDSVALALPSLRPELLRILKVLFAAMNALMLINNNSSFGDRYVLDEVVLSGYSFKVSRSWTVKSCCLVLDPVNVDQFLQVFLGNIFVRLDDLVYYLS